jgi:hypothetical protein
LLIGAFAEDYVLTISQEQADEYLDSLSDLFITFSSMHEEAPHP